jgi:hypothetical protein
LLTAYETQTKRLLQNPAAPTALYATTDIDSWINIARGQLAGEAECVRVLGTVSTVVGQRNYNFSAISTGNSATTGVAGVIHVRRINFGIASGQQWLTPRAWPWFEFYHLNDPVPPSGLPAVWSQYGQGSAGTSTGSGASGSFYIDPIPDDIYTLYCDCVCYPITLTDDNTVEALPYLWTDAVPFFAAYYALLSAQTNARQADAERYYGHYQTFVQRARQAANPSVLRHQYEQSSDPTMVAKLGLQQKAAQQ